MVYSITHLAGKAKFFLQMQKIIISTNKEKLVLHVIGPSDKNVSGVLSFFFCYVSFPMFILSDFG